MDMLTSILLLVCISIAFAIVRVLLETDYDRLD